MCVLQEAGGEDEAVPEPARAAADPGEADAGRPAETSQREGRNDDKAARGETQRGAGETTHTVSKRGRGGVLQCEWRNDLTYRQPAQNGILTDLPCWAIFCNHLSILPMQIATTIT